MQIGIDRLSLRAGEGFERCAGLGETHRRDGVGGKLGAADRDWRSDAGHAVAARLVLRVVHREAVVELA